jgi:stage II sporulation protein D
MLTRRRLLKLGLAGAAVSLVGQRREVEADTGLTADRFALQTDTTPRIPASLRLRMPDGSFCNTSMEEYLRSVVPAEAIASWPIEALKAQAVAARTYAAIYVAAVGHICTTSACQNWNPALRHARTDEAIAATSGELLTYSGQMIWSEYSSSCGGQTDSRGTQFPYLQPVRCAPERGALDLSSEAAAAPFWGGQPTAYCSSASGNTRFRYSASRTRAELEAAIDQQLPSVTTVSPRYQRGQLGALLDLVVSVRAFSGRITALRIVGTGGQWEMTGESAIVSLINPIVSSSTAVTAKAVLTAERDGSGALVRVRGTGGGWGHGRGMCQWGARGQADAGRSYQQILAHYYSGTETRRVTPSRRALFALSGHILMPMVDQDKRTATPTATPPPTATPTATPEPTCG